MKLKTRFSAPRVFYHNTISTMPTQRKPLAPIDPNRPLMQELSPWQRCEITTLRGLGLKNKEIAERVFCTPATVATTLTRHPQRNTGHDLPRSGRPPALSIRTRRLILRLIRRDPKMTYAALRREAGVTVHKSTLYRMLKEEGITNWLAKKRSLLTPEVVLKRYKWAKAHKD